MPKSLTQEQKIQAAFSCGLEPAVFRAVMEIESRGSGFLSCGRPVILFERHIMYRRLKALHLDADFLMKRMPHLVNKMPGGYQNAAGEHFRLKTARHIHNDAALESASWGLFQIMGFHWKRLSYHSIGDFVQKMEESEEAQLDAFLRFLKTSPQLISALKEQDWAKFARLYNGPAFRSNKYDIRLKHAFETFNAKALS